MKIIKQEEEPGIIVDFKNSQVLEAGDRDALVYKLADYSDEQVRIVKLPKDNRFIENLLKKPNLLMDFHQLTTDMFD